LRNAHWLVLALDTAYFASHMYLFGTLGPERYERRWFGLRRKNRQLSFVREQLAQRGARRVILFTHHPPFPLEGPSGEPGDPPASKHYELAREVSRLIRPDYWAWGHIHAAAVYRDVPGRFRGRLVGHGAIPFGEACELERNPAVEWYEKDSAGDPAYPERVLNGFLRLDLDGANARESLVAENGRERWSDEL
jgi:DNA repair exonuclease SbcCD nuclease subunit